MLPGPPIRLKCPNCGGHKYIQSIYSGNTFGGKQWSDTKNDYPMLPNPSPVQHCPKCKGYYFYEDAKRKPLSYSLFESKKPYEEADKNGYGHLSFEQTNEAYDSLLTEELSDERKALLGILWLFKYNDEYGGRYTQEKEAPEGILNKRKDVLQGLIQLHLESNNNLFVAELYRELGEFDKCIELASRAQEEGGFQAVVAEQIIQHAKDEDANVFEINMDSYGREQQ